MKPQIVSTNLRTSMVRISPRDVFALDVLAQHPTLKASTRERIASEMKNDFAKKVAEALEKSRTRSAGQIITIGGDRGSVRAAEAAARLLGGTSVKNWYRLKPKRQVKNRAGLPGKKVRTVRKRK